MKSLTLFSAFLAILSTHSAASASDTYNIDPVHSSLAFSVSHLVISNVRGKFNEFSGTVTMDGKALEGAKGTVQTKSIDTGNSKRDSDLKSPSFFDVEKYPTITFQSKRANTKGDETILVGDYTMHGVTKEISLPVKVNGPIKDPWGNSRIGLQAKTKLNRKDFGLTYNKTLETGGMVVGDEVEIEINAEAIKAAAK